jgi:hypothetical protein
MVDAESSQGGSGSTGMLSLHGVPVYVSGVAGHFVDADKCAVRLHWRVGDFRVSTVGAHRAGETIGAERYSETAVFRVRDRIGEPEGKVVGWNPIITVWAPQSGDSREAERLHYEVATTVARAVASGWVGDDDIWEVVSDMMEGRP